ncbi:hypothetical protein [Planococcus maritimus]|uniref:hypothetical protein n=1 Tax=Planococcus maritimus TaxID=192421 RepID=UPI000799008D|nr:hypothetical protein [Planococcus maritimus]KYG57881.1 hypothetical protein AY633_12985 [Planococcus maritimus]
MHKVKLYCESNNHNGTIIFDTVDLQGLKQLWEDEFVDKKWNEEDQRSLIEVTDLKYFPYRPKGRPLVRSALFVLAQFQHRF